MLKYTDLLNESANPKRYNKIIDFTYLGVDVNIDKIRKICNEAKTYGFHSICIKPEYVPYAKQFLKGSEIKICTVISFPEGTDKPKEKLKESETAIIDGADEVDVVMNYKMLKTALKIEDEEEKERKLEYITSEISNLVRLCHGINSVIIKVIIETGQLTLEQIKSACEICTKCGVDFVKTSTGHHGGADVEKVKFMRKILPDSVKIKASGGIRSIEDIEKFVKAGAERIGTSTNPSLIG